MSKKKIIFFWITSLLLALLAWPPSSFSLLILLCYAPVIALCVEIKETKKLLIYLYSFYNIFVFIKTIGLLTEGHFINGLVLAMFVLPILWMIPLLLLNYFVKKGLTIWGFLIFPFLYIANEYWQYYWDLSFIGGHLSFSLGEDWLMNSVYPQSGVLGMSFIIISSNSLLAFFYTKPGANKKGWHLAFFALSVVLLLVSLIPIQQNGDQSKSIHEIKIGVFSPKSSDTKKLAEDFEGQIEFLKESLKKSDLTDVDFVVGPEAYLSDLDDHPLFTNLLDQNEYIKQLKIVCKEKQIKLLIGAILVELIKSDDYPTSSAKKKEDGLFYEIYNGSILISPDAPTEWRTKQILMPFVEKIPFHPIINRLSETFSLIPRMNNTYGVNSNIRPYQINGIKLVNSICYEGLYPFQLKNRIEAQGADLQIILSNDWTVDEKAIDQYETYCHAVGKGCDISTLLVNMNEKSVYLNKNGSTQRFEEYPISVNRIFLTNK